MGSPLEGEMTMIGFAPVPTSVTVCVAEVAPSELSLKTRGSLNEPVDCG